MMKETHIKLIQKIIIFILTILVINILIYGIKAAINGNLLAYDYGLYQQAVFEIAAGNSLNPYLPIRLLPIFNDHFMPILLTAAPFAWLTQYHVSTLIIVEWLWFVAFILVALRLSWHNTLNTRIFIIFACLFSKGILTGIHSPVHPGVWSSVVWLCLVASLFYEKEKFIIISALAICFFRESYPFCVVALGVILLFYKRLRLGSIILAIGFSYILFTFFLRPELFGHVHDYGGPILKSLLSSPFGEILSAFKKLNYEVFLKVFYPFIIPLYIAHKITDKKKIFWAVLFMLSPYVFLHFLANQFGHQYSVPIVASFIALMIFTGAAQEITKNKKLFFLCALIFFVNGNSFQRRFLRFTFKPFENGNLLVSEKVDYIKKTKQILLQEIPNDKDILITPNSVVPFLNPGLKAYVPTYFNKTKHIFDYLLIEKRFGNVSHNVAQKDIPYLKEHCLEAPGSEILLENKYYLFIKGPIYPKCFSILKP